MLVLSVSGQTYASCSCLFFKCPNIFLRAHRNKLISLMFSTWDRARQARNWFPDIKANATNSQTRLPRSRYLCSYLVTEIIGLIFRNDKRSRFQLISLLWKSGHYVSKYDLSLKILSLCNWKKKRNKTITTSKYQHNYLTLNVEWVERERIYVWGDGI